MIERQIHLSSGGGAALQGYDGLLRFGYTKNRGVYRGSPPRMRGKVLHSRFCYTLRRITPACAGKSSAGCIAAVTVEDHPRVCGEKFSLLSIFLRLRGSPPRVRGKD